MNGTVIIFYAVSFVCRAQLWEDRLDVCCIGVLYKSLARLD